MNSADILNSFLDSLVINKKCSQNTLSAYRRDIQSFFEYVSFKGIEFSDATQNDILEYKNFMTESGKSSSTVSRTMSSLRSFYKYLVTVSVCDANPAVKIRNDKLDKKYFEILSEGEIDTLLSIPDSGTYKGKRDKAILETLYATGLKVSELISLNVYDFNAKMGCIKCNAEKSRVILLYPTAVKAINDYLNSSRIYYVSGSDEEALFVNTNGERMTRQGLWKLIKHYADNAGINKSITTY